MIRFIVVIFLAHFFLQPIELLGSNTLDPNTKDTCLQQFLNEVPVDPDQPATEFSENIFTKTFVPSIISASIWFLGVRGIHGLYENNIQEIASSAVFITLGIDLWITSISHYISQSDSKGLKDLMSGKYFGIQNEDVSRSIANIILGSTIIASSWTLTGSPMQAAIINAIGICSIVYPNLQWIKNFLFRKLPVIQDKKLFKEFLQENSLTNQNSLTLSQLQNYLLDFPLEEWFQKFQSDPKISKIIEKIHKQNVLEKKKKARLQLLRLVHKTTDIKNIKETIQKNQAIHFESIHTLLQLIIKRNKRQNTKLFFRSFLDMGVSVGFAGGLLLHHATEMTQQGIHIFSFLIGQ